MSGTWGKTREMQGDRLRLTLCFVHLKLEILPICQFDCPISICSCRIGQTGEQIKSKSTKPSVGRPWSPCTDFIKKRIFYRRWSTNPTGLASQIVFITVLLAGTVFQAFWRGSITSFLTVVNLKVYRVTLVVVYKLSIQGLYKN